MPYKSESIIIAGTKYDRRVKLSDDQKSYIKWLREEEALSYQKLADIFHVSKRTIIFICRPELYQKNLQQFKERRKDGRYKISKDEWAETMREHRAYKENLAKKGIIQ